MFFNADMEDMTKLAYGIVTKDICNYCSKNKRSRIAEGDARTVLGLMLKRKKSNPDFYFDYKVDDGNRLMSLFWCDTHSRMNYQSFADVVVFDSTYRCPIRWAQPSPQHNYFWLWHHL